MYIHVYKTSTYNEHELQRGNHGEKYDKLSTYLCYVYLNEDQCMIVDMVLDGLGTDLLYEIKQLLSSSSWHTGCNLLTLCVNIQCANVCVYMMMIRCCEI